jgi:hypothetical protein
MSAATKFENLVLKKMQANGGNRTRAIRAVANANPNLWAKLTVEKNRHLPNNGRELVSVLDAHEIE